MSDSIAELPAEPERALAVAIEYCRTHECALHLRTASLQERRRIAAELSSQLEHASQSCSEDAPQLQFLALHARRHLRRAALQHEPALSMTDLAWLSDFERRVDEILDRAVSRHTSDGSSLECTWNLLTWETALLAAAEEVPPPAAAPARTVAAARREDLLQVAVILLGASLVAFFLHRPTGIVLGVVTAAIYAYAAVLPPIHADSPPRVRTPPLGSIPALAALTRDELRVLARSIENERNAIIGIMERSPCGDPSFDPYDVVDLADA